MKYDIIFFYEINHPTAVGRCVPTRFYYYYRVIRIVRV